MRRTRIALVAALFLIGQPLASGQEMPTIYETYQPDPQYATGYVVGLDDNWISKFGAGPGWSSDVQRKAADARKLTQQVGSGAHGFSFDLLSDRRVGAGAHGFPLTRPYVPRPSVKSVSLGACNTDGTRAGCLMQSHLEDRLSGRISKEEYLEGLEAQGKGAILGAGGGVMFLASVESAVALGAYYGYSSLATGLLGTGLVAGDMMFMASSPLAQETFMGIPMSEGGAVLGALKFDSDVFDHNMRTIYQEFNRVADLESIGGNAGDAQRAVNMMVERGTGKIIYVGNYPDQEMWRRAGKGELSYITVVERMSFYGPGGRLQPNQSSFFLAGDSLDSLSPQARQNLDTTVHIMNRAEFNWESRAIRDTITPPESPRGIGRFFRRVR